MGDPQVLLDQVRDLKDPRCVLEVVDVQTTERLHSHFPNPGAAQQPQYYRLFPAQTEMLICIWDLKCQ